MNPPSIPDVAADLVGMVAKARMSIDNVCVLEEGHDNVTWHPMLRLLDKTTDTAKAALNAAYWQVEGIRALADAIAAQLGEQP